MSAARWIVPAVLVVGLLALLAWADPGQLLDNGAPPAEELAFERVELSPGVIVLHVRNAVAADVTIAQVLVDDAYWQFDMEPATTLGRYAAGTITLEYPWVEGEAHAIAVMTSTGVVWEHEIAAALETPQPDRDSFARYALIGVLVGLIPVAIGMAMLPAMRTASPRRLAAVLAFTLGLLAFLLVDTVEDGLELAEELPGAFHGLGLFFGAALLAVASVLALDGALKARGGGAFALALLIAVAIGLHNLGEGLLIGSAFAVGSLSLGTALVVGFAIHNVTEGPAIVAPLAADGREAPARRVGWLRFVLLAAIAGLPTVVGAWLGAFSSGGVLPTIFFGLGAGAILVVLVQVVGAIRRDGEPVATPLNLVAFALGYAVMLATALFTSA